MSEIDTSLENFAEGMKLLGEKDLSSAAERFEKVIAETDGRHLRDRARQFLAICRNHLDQDDNVEDLFLAAVVKKKRWPAGRSEEPVRSRRLRGLKKFTYLKASIEALAGNEDEALELLEKAIDLEPKNRVHAFHDPDFEDLRGHEGFTALINPPQAAAPPASDTPAPAAGTPAAGSPTAGMPTAGTPTGTPVV